MCWCRVCSVERPRGAFHSFGSGRRLVWREHGPATFARAALREADEEQCLASWCDQEGDEEGGLRGASTVGEEGEESRGPREGRLAGSGGAEAPAKAAPWQGKRAADAGKGPAKKKKKSKEGKKTFVGKRKT